MRIYHIIPSEFCPWNYLVLFICTIISLKWLNLIRATNYIPSEIKHNKEFKTQLWEIFIALQDNWSWKTDWRTEGSKTLYPLQIIAWGIIVGYAKEVSPKIHKHRPPKNTDDSTIYCIRKFNFYQIFYYMYTVKENSTLTTHWTYFNRIFNFNQILYTLLQKIQL